MDLEGLLAMKPEHGPGSYTGEDGLLYCTACKTAKQMHIVILGRDRVVPIQCACMREKREREAAEEKARQWEKRVQRLRAECFEEPAMEQCSFEADDRHDAKLSDTMRRYVDRWREMKESNTGLLLYGPVGTGKTFYAACIANGLIDRGVPVLLTSFTRIINTMQGMYDGRQDYIDEVANYPLLVLDDLGSERNSDYMLEQAFSILDARYKAGLPLIVTTNVPIVEIKEPRDLKYKRMYDRLIEMCFPIQVEGASRRRKKVIKTFDEKRKLLGL